MYVPLNKKVSKEGSIPVWRAIYLSFFLFVLEARQFIPEERIGFHIAFHENYKVFRTTVTASIKDFSSFVQSALDSVVDPKNFWRILTP
jgi:hypothetical protein